MTEPWLELRDRRKQIQHTQKSLCEGICAQSQLSLYEQGVLMPSDQTITKLADKLGMQKENWILAWRPHKSVVGIRQNLWHAFVKQDLDTLLKFVGQESVSSLLAEQCAYQLFVDSCLFKLEGSVDSNWTKIDWEWDIRIVQTLQLIMDANQMYIPRQMIGEGDIRLHVVLDVARANLERARGRYRSAARLDYRANQQFLKMPYYWK